MKKLIIHNIRAFIFITSVPFFLFLTGCNKEKPVEKVNKNYTVKIYQMKFTPDNLVVSVGDTVVWVNEDYVQHDVTEEKNKEWTSGPLDKDMKWSKVITKDEDYYCSIHVVMKGKIRVR